MDYKHTRDNILKYVADNKIEIKTTKDIGIAIDSFLINPKPDERGLLCGLVANSLRAQGVTIDKPVKPTVDPKSERDKYIKLMDSLYDAATRKVKPDRIAGDKWLAHAKAELQEEEIPSETRKQAREALQGMITEFAECDCCEACSEKVLAWLRKAVTEVDA